MYHIKCYHLHVYVDVNDNINNHSNEMYMHEHLESTKFSINTSHSSTTNSHIQSISYYTHEKFLRIQHIEIHFVS